MNWYEVSIYIEQKHEELITLLLYDLDINGFVIEDPTDEFYKTLRNDYGEYLEQPITFDHEDLLFKVYFNSMAIESNVMAIKKYLAKKNIDDAQVMINPINDDWIEQWKKTLKPIDIDDHIRIIPTTQEGQEDCNRINIKIEPGMAFGTGSHETTSLSIKFIEKYLSPDSTVFDIGCGSGILSIVADKLGAKAVTAIDIDQKAIAVASKNFELNDVKNVTLIHGNLLDVIDGQPDLIVANILYNILIDLVEYITDYMTEDTIFISSGILDVKKALVKTIYESNGLEIIDEMQDGEWVVLAAKKRSYNA